ncbi:membrane protein insertion efficiency factor YidD [Alloalcanivorax xenomutans]|uniref:membrane protein insertion efficiency factor YidD n=1 Tax=Alloalcanivorax xenomutans TaxID=1094342 RepID=UPI0009ED316D|nr:membrane protein insertion efficiency factor YidD [Alloalcanivorax xenomutans]WOD28737.1 membrane protein insertion efficiency factor YidD [Alloalcanivorax xenomutans]
MVTISILLVRLYQRLASKRLRGSCRFTPTCSEYAILVLKKYGFFKGWKLTVSRLVRCKPPYGGEDWP